MVTYEKQNAGNKTRKIKILELEAQMERKKKHKNSRYGGLK